MHCNNVQNVLSKFTMLENSTWKIDWWSMFLSKLNWTRTTLLFLKLRDEPVARRSAMRAGLELTELGIS